MNRRPVFYSNKHERKNVAELSPRFAAKKAQPVRQGTMAGQASAHMKKRKPDVKVARLQSPIYCRPKAEIKRINEQKQMLSQQQIRSSAIYKLLEQQIRELARRQEDEIEKLKKVREDRKKESQTLKKDMFATKMQIWELRNQVLDIKELIQEERNESERLMQQVNPGQHRVSSESQEQVQADLTQNQQQSYETQSQH